MKFTSQLNNVFKGTNPWIAAMVLVAIGSKPYSFFSPRIPEIPSAPPSTEAQITIDSGFAIDPVLSPDGNHVAYASDRAQPGKLDLWLQRIDDSSTQAEAKRLTNDSSDNSEPSFSADGTQIVFHSTRDGGGVYVIPVVGGEPRRIAKDGHHPVFSPDGEYVAFEARSIPSTPPSPSPITIRLTRLATGESRELQPGFGTMLHPRWSPDSKQIAFIGAHAHHSHPNDFDVWICPVENGVAFPTGVKKALWSTDGYSSRESFDFSYSAYVPVAWLPDGILVAGSTNIWEVQPPSPNSTTQDKPRPFLSNAYGQIDVGAGSSGLREMSLIDTLDGRLFAVSRRNRIERIWSLPLGDGKNQSLGNLQVVTSGPHDRQPRISSDGKKLLFLSGSTQEQFAQVHERDMVTRREIALTTAPARPSDLVLSADGLAFAFVDYDTGHPNATKGSGTGYRSPLPHITLNRFCENCWAISGISFEANRISWGKQVLDYSTGRTHAIFPDKAPVWNARFSADQQWIVFLAGSNVTQAEAYAAPYSDAGPITRESWIAIADGSYKATAAQWSPEGDVIYFVSRKDGFACLWAQRLASDSKLPTGSPVAVQHFHNADQVLNDDVAIADGLAVFPLLERRSTIWIVTRTLPQRTGVTEGARRIIESDVE